MFERFLFEEEKLFLSEIGNPLCIDRISYAYENHLDIIELIFTDYNIYLKLLLEKVDKEWIRLCRESVGN
jgi:hypothetical protein